MLRMSAPASLPLHMLLTEFCGHFSLPVSCCRLAYLDIARAVDGALNRAGVKWSSEEVLASELYANGTRETDSVAFTMNHWTDDGEDIAQMPGIRILDTRKTLCEEGFASGALLDVLLTRNHS